MGLTVICEYQDGEREVVRDDFSELNHAVRFALDMAGRLARKKGDRHGPPAFVHVVDKTTTELTIRVFRTGLAPPKAK